MKFSSAYNGLKTDKYNLVVYPMLYLYRRLTIPVSVTLMKDQVLAQFLWIQLTGSIIICQVICMKPFVNAFDNFSIVIEELTVVFLVYITLCFTDWMPVLELRHRFGYAFISIVMSILVVYNSTK